MSSSEIGLFEGLGRANSRFSEKNWVTTTKIPSQTSWGKSGLIGWLGLVALEIEQGSNLFGTGLAALFQAGDKLVPLVVAEVRHGLDAEFVSEGLEVLVAGILGVVVIDGSWLFCQDLVQFWHKDVAVLAGFPA